MGNLYTLESLSSFFMINKTRAPQNKALGQIEPLLRYFYNWDLNSFILVEVIPYGGIQIEQVPDSKLI